MEEEPDAAPLAAAGEGASEDERERQPGPRSGAAPPPPRRPGSDEVTRRDYVGCGVWALGFLVLVVVSFAVGSVLRPDPDPNDSPDAVTLAGSVADDSRYRLVGRTDESDDPCVTLVRDTDDGEGQEEVTGQCGVSASAETEGEAGDVRYVVTSSELPDGTTVVFGPVPRQTVTVRLALSDGSEPEVDVRRSEEAAIIWFAYETDQTVSGPAEMLDANGDAIPPP